MNLVTTFIERTVFGCPIKSFVNEDLVKTVLETEFLGKNFGSYSVAINAEKLVRQVHDKELKQILIESNFPIVDGAGAVIALKMLHGIDSIKVDLPRLLLETLNARSGTLFVYGASCESNGQAVETIKIRYPKIDIIDAMDGYQPQDHAKTRIIKSNPDAVLVGLGTPKQEIFIRECIDMGAQSFFVGCGGAIDILAGKVQRAPNFMVDNYLEWLYRLFKQPSRWRRQLILPRFVALLIREKFFARR